MSKWNPREQYWAYRRGWTDGAKRMRLRKVFVESTKRPDMKEAYERGYADGKKARNDALTKEADRLGHDRMLVLLRDEALDKKG